MSVSTLTRNTQLFDHMGVKRVDASISKVIFVALGVTANMKIMRLFGRLKKNVNLRVSQSGWTTYLWLHHLQSSKRQ